MTTLNDLTDPARWGLEEKTLPERMREAADIALEARSRDPHANLHGIATRLREVASVFEAEDAPKPTAGTVRVVPGPSPIIYVERPDGKHVAVYLQDNAIWLRENLAPEVPGCRDAETVWAPE